MKLAIVGSEDKYWTDATRRLAQSVIRGLLTEYNLPGTHLVMISGGCPKGGIDIWAEEMAKSMSIEVDIKRPESLTWHDTFVRGDGDTKDIRKIGYRSRNLLIAKECDVIFTIEPIDRNWSGGMFTASWAKKYKKEAWIIRISIDGLVDRRLLPFNIRK